MADRWNTIASAFLAYGYPDENLPLVRRIVDGIGIDHYERTKSGYIKAVHKDGGRRLCIHFGYTTGFTSEQEILDTAGDVDRWPNGKHEWGVTHPMNRIRD